MSEATFYQATLTSDGMPIAASVFLPGEVDNESGKLADQLMTSSAEVTVAAIIEHRHELYAPCATLVNTCNADAIAQNACYGWAWVRDSNGLHKTNGA